MFNVDRKPKPIEEIRQEFDAAMAKLPQSSRLPQLTKAGKYFISVAIVEKGQVPGKLVVEGKVQDGEFD